MVSAELNPVVVCVDDDPNVLSAVKRLLRREPYDLLTTDRPSTALRWIGDRRVDLLITDLKMPEMSGADLIKVVEERSPRTQSLIVTGFPEKASETRSRLLAKPWSDSEFRETVRSLLAVPQQKPSGLPILAAKMPFPRAQVLIVDPDERFRSLAEETLAPEGFDLCAVAGGADCLRALRSPGWTAEIVLVSPDAVPGGEADLIRLMRRLVPGLHVLVVAEAPSRDQIRSWYDAGAADVLPKTIPADRLSDLLKRSVYPARKNRDEAGLVGRERDRRAADPWQRRLLHQLRRVLRGELRTFALMGVSACLIGAFLATRVDLILGAFDLPSQLLQESRPGLADRLRAQAVQEDAVRRWYLSQQLELGRDQNEQTRRYREAQLFEQRWEGIRPRRQH